jgi:DNA-binding NarL/FixJ family response regulator
MMLNIVVIHPDRVLTNLLKKVTLHESDWNFLIQENSFENFHNSYPKRARIDVAIVDAAEMVHLQDLKALSHQVKIIVLADIEVIIDALKAFHNGALGYLSKAEFITQIPYYIKTVMSGGILISPIVARHLIDSLYTPIPEGLKNNYLLTPKEIEVIHLLSMGYSYDKMATVMGITKNGVRYHVQNILAKLKVNNRVDATRKWNNTNNLLDSQQEG